jgi:PAS domain S-box-containing protein
MVGADLPTKDGGTVQTEIVASVLTDAGGRVTGLLGVTRDITERKRTEESLRLRDSALAAAANAIVITDTEGRIEWANPAFALLTGYDLDEVRGQNPRFLNSGVQDGAFYEQMWRTITSGSVWQGEMVNRRRDGTLYPEEMTITPVRENSGAITHFIAVKQDVTEHKHLEEQLRQSQKMEAVGQLAGGVAHDFNNLLQAMLSLTQMLVPHHADPRRLETDAAELEQLVRRGAALTRQLLLFSRRETVHSERLDLNEVVRESVTLLRRLLKANVALETRLADARLPVEGDRGQLGQVLLNLVVNAADAMPDGGRLVIETGSESGAVWLKVADTGGGIPAAICDHIFEPFFTTKGQGKGTGLGLSVVHGIVTQHGGTVTFESREGHGTAFSVTLPRAGSGESPLLEVAERSGATPRGSGERVLVVEDEETARQALCDILTMLGYTVTAVASGEEAGKLAPEQPFEVLLTDLMLPGITGGELATGLQARWPELRVVLMSGYAEDEAVRLASRAGTVRFLQKPFDMDTLARELRAALDADPAMSPPGSSGGRSSC